MTKTSLAVPIFLGLALLLSIVVAFATLLATVAAEESNVETSLPTESDLLKMKVRDLKAILAKKGPDAACLACTSKREYVDRIAETHSWDDVDPEPKGPNVDDLYTEDPDIDPERLQKLKESLKASGIDTSKLFASKDGTFNDKEFEKIVKKWETMRKNNSEDEKKGEVDPDVKDESSNNEQDDADVHTDL